MATGNLDLCPNAMAREVTLGKSGNANGVTFIERTTGKEMHASARAIIVAGGSMASVRLLLNSKSSQFPNGIANSSGLVGKYIMETVASLHSGQIPILENLPPHNEDGAAGQHSYAPWWLYSEQLAGKLNFPRGYHIQWYGGRRMPDLGTGTDLEWLTQGSYGKKFKEDVRRYYGSFVTFLGQGEMIPNDDCFCELDPIVKDKWGVPVLRFHWKWSPHEIRQAAHMYKTFEAIIRAMGGRVRGHTEAIEAQLDVVGGPERIPKIDGGSFIGGASHEVGGARMGSDPRDSVTNQWGQTHDVPNLVIADGATFVSNADKNPTLTIMALSWRATEHLASELKKLNV
jgi:choline dehydrogenase-like flavoprotein